MLFNLGDGVSHQLRRRVRIIAFYRFLSGELLLLLLLVRSSLLYVLMTLCEMNESRTRVCTQNVKCDQTESQKRRRLWQGNALINFSTISEEAQLLQNSLMVMN